MLYFSWPCIALERSDEERVYVRMHSESYETKEINEVYSKLDDNRLYNKKTGQIIQAPNGASLNRISAMKGDIGGQC